VKLRKVSVMLAALVIPISLVSVLGAGVASAKGSPVAQPGKVSCNKITGVITFNPPLTLTGTATGEQTTVKISVKGCTVTGGTVKPKKGTVNQVISTATSTDGCTSLENSQPESLQVTWAPASKIEPTTASFSGYSVVTNAKGDEGFSLPNCGGTGSAAGSYAQSSGVTATAYSGLTSSQLASACSSSAGLSSLKITSGAIG
jgi:hypothetical protein